MAAVLAAIVISGFLAGKSELDAKWTSTTAEISALAGLVGARLVFVVLHWEFYQDAPWTMLYLWQPGYNMWAGTLLGLMIAIWRIAGQVDRQRLGYLKALSAGYGLGLSLLLSIFLLLTLAQRPGVLGPGDVVPDFTMETLEGQQVGFSSLSGRAVVLNFWATWCPPCRREMPLLDAVQKEYADRGLVIVGINLSESKRQILNYLDRAAVNYPIWVDASQQWVGAVSSRELFYRFSGVGLPTTIFVDGTGQIREIYVGELNRAKLQGNVDELIASVKTQ